MAEYHNTYGTVLKKLEKLFIVRDDLKDSTLRKYSLKFDDFFYHLLKSVDIDEWNIPDLTVLRHALKRILCLRVNTPLRKEFKELLENAEEFILARAQDHIDSEKEDKAMCGCGCPTGMPKQYYMESGTGYLVGPFNSRVEAYSWYEEAVNGCLPAAEELQKWIDLSGDPDFISSIEGETHIGDFVPKLLGVERSIRDELYLDRNREEE